MKAPLVALFGSVAFLALVLDELSPIGRIEPAIGQEAEKPAPAPVPPPAADAPKVDETALRYFARQGDAKRLEAEIARLRALYPQWTPPADPLAAPVQADARLDAMWKLYSEGKTAAVRKAIADRQATEPAWQPPTDLLERLDVAEARQQLVNASDLQQFDTVIRVGSATPSLLTCGDVEVLWRVAEAFARTDRAARAEDAYRYVLDNCGDGPQRLATLQKALPLLPKEQLDALLKLEKKDAAGKGEFAPLRDDLARQAVAAGGEKPDLAVAKTDLDTVARLAEAEGKASDALLLGWYYLRRDHAEDARKWFGTAREAEDSAAASQGLALALIALKKPAEAEEVLYPRRADSDATRATYMAAVANMLAVVPPLPLDEAKLGRLATEVGAMADAAAAQQFGWYADALNQFPTAAQWFAAALGWKPDDEPSAYGLTLMRWKLGDQAGVAEMQRLWAGRSNRIATVGQPERGAVPRASVQTGAPATNAAPDPIRDGAAQPAPDRLETSSVGGAAPVAKEAPQPRPRAAANGRQTRPRGCSTTIDPATLAPREAVTRGWCLMDRNRPLEAAAAFEVGLRDPSPKAREDAAYGQSLAYLRAGLRDQAAVSAAKAPQNQSRGVELRTALLASQATGAFESKRFRETIFALDERARLAPERVDLMVLRGYAYLGLRRFGDAERIFRAAAATGNRDARKGLGALAQAREATRR